MTFFLVVATTAIWHRRRHEQGSALDRWLAAVLVLAWPATTLQHWLNGDLNAANALPMHYCDWALIACIIALFSRGRFAAEVGYFFGLSGTLQGLITPALDYDWPHPAFFTFFLSHGGVVVAAVYLAFGMRLEPRPWSVPRMTAFTILYGFSAAGVNLLLGTNYGFVCSKPPNGSIMDFLGPWPWYLIALPLVGAVLYTILMIPVLATRSSTSTAHKLA